MFATLLDLVYSHHVGIRATQTKVFDTVNLKPMDLNLDLNPDDILMT